MNKPLKYLIFLLCVILIQSSWAQDDSKSICIIDNGKIIFRINLKWDESKRNEVSKQFDIDSLVMDMVFKGLTNIINQNEKWTVKKISPNIVELSKVLDEKPIPFTKINDFLLSNDIDFKSKSINGPLYAEFGVNRLQKNNVFNYNEGVARFYLPNHDKNSRVIISGSFNGFSTYQTPMHKTDSGWIATIKLKPGKYSYKYIIDGRWSWDKNNYIREIDGNGGYNSIIYCSNYKFSLTGFTNARKVFVAGSFNSWNRDELQMQKTSSGWVLPVYLREGTHAYKFIVDGSWITDPACTDNKPDGRGNINSYLGIGDKYLFKLSGFKDASKVFLAGSFNGWNSKELEMVKVKDGWQLDYYLGPGTYEYKFIVDGKWIIDPKNPNTIGSGDYANSVLIFKANHVFTLKKYLDAFSVIVTGSFNGWNQKSYRMLKRDGEWYLPLFLNPGKYTYKFIVDGQWILDPDNKLWEENEYGTGNSVLWVEP